MAKVTVSIPDGLFEEFRQFAERGRSNVSAEVARAMRARLVDEAVRNHERRTRLGWYPELDAVRQQRDEYVRGRLAAHRDRAAAAG